jgi:hypothetical protein
MKPTRVLVTGGKNFTPEMREVWISEFAERVRKGYSFSEAASFCEETAWQRFGVDCYEDEAELDERTHLELMQLCHQLRGQIEQLSLACVETVLSPRFVISATSNP